MKKRLYKSSTDKKVCGVCGGIANYFDVDPPKPKKAKKADKDTHVGDLFASLIPQQVKKNK